MGQRPLWIHVDELRAALEAINFTPEKGDDSLYKWPKHRLFATANEIKENGAPEEAEVIRQHFQAASKRRQHMRVEKMSTEKAPPPIELYSNSGDFSPEEFFADLIAGYFLSRNGGYESDVASCSKILAIALRKISGSLWVGRDRDD